MSNQQQKQKQEQQHGNRLPRMRFPKRAAGAMGVAFSLYLIILMTHPGVPTTSNPVANRGALGSEKIWRDYVAVSPNAALPNGDRKKNNVGKVVEEGVTEVSVESGTRSQHYGEIQRQRQHWLLNKASELRRAHGLSSRPGPENDFGAGSTAESGNVLPSSPTPIDHEPTTGTESTTVGAAVHESHHAVELNENPAVLPGTKSLLHENAAFSRDDAVRRQHSHFQANAADLKTNPSEAGKVNGGGGEGKPTQRAPKTFLTIGMEGPEVAEVRASSGGGLRQQDGRSTMQEVDQPTATTIIHASVGPLSTAAKAVREMRVPVSRERSLSDAVESKTQRLRAPLERTGHAARDQGRDTEEVRSADERKEGKEAGGKSEGEGSTAEERVRRLEHGAELWGATYVPPIEPGRRREMIEKWSKPLGEGEARAGKQGGGRRILYVVSSFDRGERLGSAFKGDKMNYVLMMIDEMREACEEGFLPQVHFIAAWDPVKVSDLVRDRLYCQRIGDYVPYSHEQHSPAIGNLLSIKHRIYMKPRLEDFDVFIQVEDDMILTLNHILLYLEHSKTLANRRGATRPADYSILPGFIRVEPGDGMGEEGIGEEWFEWEIILSRFRAMQITGAGTYMCLGPSTVLKHGGNNQGLWMATQGQLRFLDDRCKYLDFSELSTHGHVETHSGSIQMFSVCGIEKVFPAAEFESFLVHHRTNNKNGHRGESIPAVPISMLRVWAGQFLRDAGFLEVHNRKRRLLRDHKVRRENGVVV